MILFVFKRLILFFSQMINELEDEGVKPLKTPEMDLLGKFFKIFFKIFIPAAIIGVSIFVIIIIVIIIRLATGSNVCR